VYEKKLIEIREFTLSQIIFFYNDSLPFKGTRYLNYQKKKGTRYFVSITSLTKKKLKNGPLIAT
jgi:hypothetical protein